MKIGLVNNEEKVVDVGLNNKEVDEIIEKMHKNLKKNKRRKIIINILMILSVIIFTMTCIMIGKRYDIEFIMGQLSIMTIFTVSFVINKFMFKIERDEAIEILLENEKINNFVENEFKKLVKNDE